MWKSFTRKKKKISGENIGRKTKQKVKDDLFAPHTLLPYRGTLRLPSPLQKRQTWVGPSSNDTALAAPSSGC